MQIADEPSPLDLTHDEFNRVKRGELAWLVEHREENAREQLHHEHQQREAAEVVPNIEVLRRVVARELIGDELFDRESLVDPGSQLARLDRRRAGRLNDRGHYAAPDVFFALSRPMTSVRSSAKS